jgi:hypothetical protein
MNTELNKIEGRICQALRAALHAGTECCPVGVSTQAGEKTYLELPEVGPR